MLLQKIKTTEIVSEVKNHVSSAKKEILATMLLSEEVSIPLPKSYHVLLQQKVHSGVILKRIGFGKKKDYDTIKKREELTGRYIFRYCLALSDYQRLIIIDREVLFFGIDGSFFKTTYKPLVKVFSTYFLEQFRKAKL